MASKDTPVTVTGMVEAAAAAALESPAIVYGGATLTYTGLTAQARRVAGGLASLGVRAGDRVAFWLPNTPAYVTLYLACVRLGAVAVAVNTRYRAGEVGDIIGRSGAKVLALWPDFRGIDFPGILADVDPAALDKLDAVIVYTEDATAPAVSVPGARVVAWDRIARHARHDVDHAVAETGCNIFNTSGTTRAPKFVLHGHGGIVGHAGEVATALGLRERDTVAYLGLPLCGVFGFCQMMAVLAAGKPTILTSAFEADEAVRLFERYAVTYFNASDDMIDRMLRVPGARAPFRHVRETGYGAFNSELGDIVARADAQGLTLTGLWGMSEMQALVARRPPDASVEVRATPGGVLISPAAKIRARDPDSGSLLGPGEAGELEISGPSRMLEYYGDAAATQAAFTEDGFLRTGDLGKVEADGGFEFMARMGDVLRLGGFLVSPAEIEAQIQAHPLVESVQVVAAGSASGNRAVAFVTVDKATAFDEAAIQAHCAQQLAKFKVPARVVAVDEFPVTESANGIKIQRAKLREMAEALLN